MSKAGTDAPICQDGRSGRQVCGLARSVVCHHALKDLAGEKAFETADDLPFGPPFSGASFDVVEGWCVELHPHDDGPVERGVGLAMTAAVEAVAPRRHPGRSRDGAGPAKLGEGGFRMNPIGGVAKMISSSAAVSAPMPKPSRSVGEVWVVSRLKGRSVTPGNAGR